VELEKTLAQKRKDDAKVHVTQLAEKKCNKKEAVGVREAREVAQAATEQKKAIEAMTAAQTAEATTVQAEEGQAVSTG